MELGFRETAKVTNSLGMRCHLCKYFHKHSPCPTTAKTTLFNSSLSSPHLLTICDSIRQSTSGKLVNI